MHRFRRPGGLGDTSCLDPGAVMGPLCGRLPTGTDPGGPETLKSEPADQALQWIPVLTIFEAGTRTTGLDADLGEWTASRFWRPQTKRLRRLLRRHARRTAYLTTARAPRSSEGAHDRWRWRVFFGADDRCGSRDDARRRQHRHHTSGGRDGASRRPGRDGLCRLPGRQRQDRRHRRRAYVARPHRRPLSRAQCVS
jgi:hypothetical protein